MPNIDPKVAFYLGLALCVVQIIYNGGPTFLEGVSPTGAIVILVAWCKVVSGIGTGIMTYIAGTNMTTQGRLQNVQPVPPLTRAVDLANDNEVAHVVLKSQADADSVPGNKVIGPNNVTLKAA